MSDRSDIHMDDPLGEKKESQKSKWIFFPFHRRGGRMNGWEKDDSGILTRGRNLFCQYIRKDLRLGISVQDAQLCFFFPNCLGYNDGSMEYVFQVLAQT